MRCMRFEPAFSGKTAPAIFEGLKKRGYDDEALAKKIAGLNYYRVLSGTLEE